MEVKKKKHKYISDVGDYKVENIYKRTLKWSHVHQQIFLLLGLLLARIIPLGTLKVRMLGQLGDLRTEPQMEAPYNFRPGL